LKFQKEIAIKEEEQTKKVNIKTYDESTRIEHQIAISLMKEEKIIQKRHSIWMIEGDTFKNICKFSGKQYRFSEYDKESMFIKMSLK
jgi:hypothetical protein